MLASIIWVALYGMFKQIGDVWKYFKLSIWDMVRREGVGREGVGREGVGREGVGRWEEEEEGVGEGVVMGGGRSCVPGAHNPKGYGRLCVRI